MEDLENRSILPPLCRNGVSDPASRMKKKKKTCKKKTKNNTQLHPSKIPLIILPKKPLHPSILKIPKLQFPSSPPPPEKNGKSTPPSSKKNPPKSFLAKTGIREYKLKGNTKHELAVGSSITMLGKTPHPPPLGKEKNIFFFFPHAPSE